MMNDLSEDTGDAEVVRRVCNTWLARAKEDGSANEHTLRFWTDTGSTGIG